MIIALQAAALAWLWQDRQQTAVSHDSALQAATIAAEVQGDRADDLAVELADVRGEMRTLRTDTAQLRSALGKTEDERDSALAEAEERTGEAVWEPAYAPPDPATLRRLAVDAVSAYVDRDPHESEIDSLVALLLDLDRQAFDASLRGERFDVAARFIQAIEGRYEAERQFLDRRDQDRRAHHQFQCSMDHMADMMRGDGAPYEQCYAQP